MYIRKLRKASGLTQKELADLLNVNQTAVSQWERGDGMPRAEMLPVLADSLQCTIDALFGRDTTASA